MAVASEQPIMCEDGDAFGERRMVCYDFVDQFFPT